MLIATGVMCCAPLMNGVEAVQPTAAITSEAQYVAFKADSSYNVGATASYTISGRTYTYVVQTASDGNNYWVRQGYTLVIDKNGGEYTPLSINTNRPDVVYNGTGDQNKDIITSVTSVTDVTGTKTNLGEALQKVNASSYVGVSNSAGTSVPRGWNYIIADSSWAGHTAIGTGYDTYKDGYADLTASNGESLPKGFKTLNNGLTWDSTTQTYKYGGKTVDYSHMYVIGGQLGVFTNYDGTKVYEGNVYGRHNEILMTAKDGNNFYSYWAAEVTDPSTTMNTYRVQDYRDDLNTLTSNDDKLARADIKEVKLEKSTVEGENAAFVKLYRNGFDANGVAVDGALKISSGGGTVVDGVAKDTFVKVGIGSNELELNTGSKVVGSETAIAGATKIKGISINGVNYEVGGSNYTAGSNITISGDGSISATDTNNYVTSGEYNSETKKIDFTNNDSNKNFSVDLSGITSGLSTTDYALVVNPTDGSNGKYKADGSGNLTLKVKDKNGTDTYDVVIEDVASAEKVATNTSNITNLDARVTTNTSNITNLDARVTTNTSNITNLTTRVTTNENNITANTTYISGLKDGLFKVSDGKKTATIKHNDTVNFVGGGAASVTVDETNKTVTITATDNDTKYTADDKNITIDETDSNKIKLSSALTDITSISNGTIAKIDLSNDAVKINNKVTIDKDGKISGVAAGTADTDAVNVSQLNGAKTTVAGTGNVEVSKDASKTEYNAYTVSLKSDLTDISSISGTGTSVAKITLSSTNGSVGINDVSVNKDKTITGLTNTTLNVDGFGKSNRAATEEQLQKVREEVQQAGGGWNLTTNNTDSSKYQVKPGDTVDFTGDSNISVSNVENEKGTNQVKVKLNDNIIVTSVTAGNTVMNTAGLTINGSNTTDPVLKLTNNGLSIGGTTYVSSSGLNAGSKKITNVANGDVSEESTDAVNGSQLNAVKQKAEAGWNFKTDTHESGKSTKVEPGAIVTFEGGKNIGTSYEGNTIKIDLDNSISLSTSVKGEGDELVPGTLTINAGDSGKISGLTAGTDDNDAVNVSQLQAVEQTANKGWNLTTNNTDSSKYQVKPGDTVDFAGDDNLAVTNLDAYGAPSTSVRFKLNSKLTGIESISNGVSKITINNSGIGMSVTNEAGNITNSIMVTENGTTISGGLDVAGSKITNVAAGEADTDAVNYGQLKDYVSDNDKNTHIKAGEYEVDSANKVNMVLVDEKGNEVDTVTITDVAKASEVGKLENVNEGIKGDTIVDSINKLDYKVGDLQYSKVEKGDIQDNDSTTTAIGKLNSKLSEVAEQAGQHTTVKKGSDNITITPGTNDKGGMEYIIDINKDLNIDSVTAGDTVLNKDGVKVGNDVSLSKDGLNAGGTTVTKDGLTVGDTKVTETGLQIGDKTYVSKDGLNANSQKVTNVADGEVSKDSKDAVNGSQLHATNSRIDETNQQVMNNTQNISKLGSRLNKVGAGAAALAALHPMDFDPDDKLTFAAGVGNYGGENAAAIGAYYRPDEKVMFSVGGTMGNGENMVNAGISFALDRTNHVSNSRTAMAREIVDLRAEINELKAMLAKGGLGSIDEDKLKIFPDVAENHWAYEYVGKLAAAGIVEGFPNGEFDGDRMMSRYEFAAMLYRAMQKGAQLDSRIINEFAPEMGRIRVDRISGADNDKRKIERVRVNGTDKAKNDYRDHYGSKIAK